MKKTPLILLISLFIFACNYTEKVRDGRSAFERKQYKSATQLLEKDFRKEKSKKEKGNISFMIAESYQKIGNIEKATIWYATAIENAYGAEAIRGQANGLKQQGLYPEAIAAYKNLGMEIGSSFEVKKDILACQNAQIWLSPKARNPYTIEKTNYNSAFDDYAPAIYLANQLAITSDRPNVHSPKNNYKWTGRSFSDIFLIDKSNNTTKNFSNLVNTEANEGAATFDASHQLMIFSRNYAEGKNDDAYMQLHYSTREGIVWDTPKILNFTKEKVNYSHPSLSSDGKKLFFAANDSDGIGGFDIYVSERKQDYEWSEPKLLPRSINTIGNEVFPTLHADTLYFSSDNHAGIGGLDIFKSYPIANGWSAVQNLRAPVNSSADDFGLIVDNQAIKKSDELQKGYFVSNRKDGQGGDDIYAFVKKQLPPLPPDTTKNKPNEPSKTITYRIVLDGYVLEKIYQQSDNPNSKIIGRRPIANAAIQIQFGNDKRKLVSNDEGYFMLDLSENTDYQILASSVNYLNSSTSISTKGIIKDPNTPTQRIEAELILDKIYKNREITLDNIYYDFDKSDIREDAKPTLNLLARTLRENPTIKIQLNSHTDCRGNDRYNEDLSQRRAQSAVDYLISLGVGSERLTAKGYGESQPAVICVCNQCSEADLQANRRTTFKILD